MAEEEGSEETSPEVIAALPVRRVCRGLIFARGALRARSVKAWPAARVDQLLAERIARLIGIHPTFGYRCPRRGPERFVIRSKQQPRER